MVLSDNFDEDSGSETELLVLNSGSRINRQYSGEDFSFRNRRKPKTTLDFKNWFCG